MRHHGPDPDVHRPGRVGQRQRRSRQAYSVARELRDARQTITSAPVCRFEPGKTYPLPGFADDQQYRYYFGIARAGGKMPEPLAFKTIYDAYTEPMLYRLYSDDAPVPPGINRFDLHPYNFRDGKPEDYRSQRKGHYNRPRPTGSRMGPQKHGLLRLGLQC